MAADAEALVLGRDVSQYCIMKTSRLEAIAYAHSELHNICRARSLNCKPGTESMGARACGRFCHNFYLVAYNVLSIIRSSDDYGCVREGNISPKKVLVSPEQRWHSRQGQV